MGGVGKRTALKSAVKSPTLQAQLDLGLAIQVFTGSPRSESARSPRDLGLLVYRLLESCSHGTAASTARLLGHCVSMRWSLLMLEGCWYELGKKFSQRPSPYVLFSSFFRFPRTITSCFQFFCTLFTHTQTTIYEGYASIYTRTSVQNFLCIRGLITSPGHS